MDAVRVPRMTGRVASLGAAVVIGVGAIGGVVPVPGGVTPVAADCGMQLERSIGPYRGFAVEGVVTDVTLREVSGEGWLYRITLDVTELLAGPAVDPLVFDLGVGSCTILQGDRYKVGDRLILTDAGPPRQPDPGGPDVRHITALTWRHEWADHWTLHGLPDEARALMSPRIRGADTRDQIIALVAPERLPYAIDRAMWRVALPRSASGGSLQDVVAWRNGFVALGTRSVRGRDRVTWTIRTSPDGERWSAPRTPFGAGRTGATGIARLVVFRDALYAVGWSGESVRVWRSEDGRRWTSVLDQPWRDPDPLRSPAAVMTLRDLGVAADDTRLVVLAHSSDVASADTRTTWTTQDGMTWERTEPTGLTTELGELVATADGFAIPYSDWAIRTSPDGVAWTEAGTQPEGLAAFAADRVRDRWLAAITTSPPGYGSMASLEVADATDPDAGWVTMVGPMRGAQATRVTAADGTLVLTGEGSTAVGRGAWSMTSRDAGATWTLSPVPVGRDSWCMGRVAIGPARIVAVGSCRGAIAWTANR